MAAGTVWSWPRPRAAAARGSCWRYSPSLATAGWAIRPGCGWLAVAVSSCPLRRKTSRAADSVEPVGTTRSCLCHAAKPITEDGPDGRPITESNLCLRAAAQVAADVCCFGVLLEVCFFRFGMVVMTGPAARGRMSRRPGRSWWRPLVADIGEKAMSFAHSQPGRRVTARLWEGRSRGVRLGGRTSTVL